jgi:hypothetical protein
VLELQGERYGDGDRALRLAPGLLYEARSWAAEWALRFPLSNEMESRAEEKFTVTAGLRWLF